MVGQRVRQGLPVVEAALDLARRTGSRSVQGHAMCTKGVLLAESGRLQEGLRLLHDSGEIAREAGQADDLARAFQNLTYVQLFAGLADEALAAARAGLQVVRRQGRMLSSGIGITEHQAEAAVRVGRWDDALALLDAFPYVDLEAPPWSVSPPPASMYSSGAVNSTRRRARWRRPWSEPPPWTMPTVPTPGSGPRSWPRQQPPRRRPRPCLGGPGGLGPLRRHDLRAQGVQRRDLDRSGLPRLPAPSTVEALHDPAIQHIEAVARSFGGQRQDDGSRSRRWPAPRPGNSGGRPQPEAWRAAAVASDHCRRPSARSALCRFGSGDTFSRGG